MKVKRELILIIRGRQWRFVKLLLRETNGMERNIIETELVSKRVRGRQRVMMFDWMTMKFNLYNVKDLGSIEKDRQKWRKS